MSRIIVDAIRNSSAGSDGITLSSDGKVTFPNTSTGKILQVKQVTKTDTFSSTSSTFTDLTGMSVSITPSSTSSKILVTFSLGCFQNGTAGSRAFLTIVRDSTNLLLGDATTGHECTYAVCTRSANSNHIQIPVSGSFLDSPSTTSATTYKLQCSVGNDGGTMTLNKANTVDAQSGNAASTITVMEVAA